MAPRSAKVAPSHAAERDDHVEHIIEEEILEEEILEEVIEDDEEEVIEEVVIEDEEEVVEQEIIEEEVLSVTEEKKESPPLSPIKQLLTSPKSRKSKKNRKPKKKGISFKKTVGVHKIPNLDTYTREERLSTWYAADDYGQMEDECDLTSEFLDSRKPLWPGYCGRGLEAWTTEGEQRKESHVQLAIDIVWQAQLEQWKASSDFHECWEFIRRRYVQVSKPCHRLANKIGIRDENEIQGYLAGVKSVERNRRRMLGISSRDTGTGTRKVRRHSSERTPTSSKKKIGRAHSERSPTGGLSPFGSPRKGVLKFSIYASESDAEDEDHKKTPKATSRKSAAATKVAKKKVAEEAAEADDCSSKGGSVQSSRKIVFRPKSKSKVPVSPVASMCTDADSDSNSTARRLRSHMSVCSDDSTRRRMLRTANIKKL